MTPWDACGNRLLVVIEPASDDRLRAGTDVARECFARGQRIADGVAWFAPRDGFFRTAFWNPDGTAERLCGNSLLVAAAALGELDDPSPATVHPFDYPAVRVRSVPGGPPSSGPATRFARVELSTTVPLAEVHRGESARGVVLDTGSPHLVVEHEGVAVVELEKLARPLALSLDVNVTLYALDGAVATVRTFERGVDAETLACGTGALAVALAVGRAVEVRYPGGTYAAQAERAGHDVRFTLSTAADRVRRV